MFLVFSLFFINVASAESYSKTLYFDDYKVEYNYGDVINNDYFNLKVGITNEGDSTKNITLKIDEEGPFEFKDSKKWNVEIGANSTVSKTFTIHVEDAESKKYNLEFNLDDGNDDWDDRFEIRVESDSPELSLGEIISSPEKITPGDKDVELTVKIKNTGDVDAEDVVATLELPDGFSASGSYTTIVHAGDISAGETKNMTFYFDVDDNLEETDYSAELNLEYKNDGEDESDSFEIQIPVFSIPLFEITNTEILSDIYPGLTSKIKVGIKNIGKDAKDVTLRVYERSDQPFSFTEKSVYIGSLKSNEIGYGIFEFEVEKDADVMNYIVDFQVRSVDGEDVIVDDVTSSIKVSAREFNITQYLFYGLLGITVLVIGGIIFFKRRH